MKNTKEIGRPSQILRSPRLIRSNLILSLTRSGKMEGPKASLYGNKCMIFRTKSNKISRRKKRKFRLRIDLSWLMKIREQGGSMETPRLIPSNTIT
jgi:hypothetical protein